MVAKTISSGLIFQEPGLEATKKLQISNVSKVHSSRPASPVRVQTRPNVYTGSIFNFISNGNRDIDQRLGIWLEPTEISIRLG